MYNRLLPSKGVVREYPELKNMNRSKLSKKIAFLNFSKTILAKIITIPDSKKSYEKGVTSRNYFLKLGDIVPRNFCDHILS